MKKIALPQDLRYVAAAAAASAEQTVRSMRNSGELAEDIEHHEAFSKHLELLAIGGVVEVGEEMRLGIRTALLEAELTHDDNRRAAACAE